MHRLFSEATTADECRIIFDMFLARSGLPAANHDTPLPSPSDIHGTQPSKADVDLEHSLVELLLSGSEVVPPRKCRRKAVPALEDLTVEITPTPKSNGNVVTTTDIIHKDTLATSVNMQTTA
jgi:hypothetical protein